jgi:hypothetical protein
MRAVATTEIILRRAATLASTAALVLGLAGGLAGCGALDVSDPTTIEDDELNDAAGAELLRGAALRTLAEVVDDGAFLGGLLADEFLNDTPVWAAPGTWPDEALDRRESQQYESMDAISINIYRRWQEVRRAAIAALSKAQAYAPARVSEMFAVRGFVTLRLAEDFCPGFPLHGVVDFKVVYGPPLSTEEALAKALADLDSAVAYAADSARVLNLARVWQGRTLLALGRFEEAGSAVAGVPTDYFADAEYSTAVDPLLFQNRLAFDNTAQGVADKEGGNGLDFASAGDPRVQLDTLGLAVDGVTPITSPAKYSTPEAPFRLASGLEARLIQAEAALRADNPQWLTILNDLRANAIAPAMPALADPDTDAAREDLLFRERAFWLFATGHRLADLRRLMQFYGRSAESVFPAGAYRLGGAYGTATSIPFPAEGEQSFNPAVTGCTSR